MGAEGRTDDIGDSGGKFCESVGRQLERIGAFGVYGRRIEGDRRCFASISSGADSQERDELACRYMLPKKTDNAVFAVFHSAHAALQLNGYFLVFSPCSKLREKTVRSSSGKCSMAS